jgi:hypothetical protein
VRNHLLFVTKSDWKSDTNRNLSQMSASWYRREIHHLQTWLAPVCLVAGFVLEALGSPRMSDSAVIGKCEDYGHHRREDCEPVGVGGAWVEPQYCRACAARGGGYAAFFDAANRWL